MGDRRTEILDGALRVLAEQGMRGLTHRAVDAVAGIPQGSTSYYFRSRSALVMGCVERMLELDLAIEAPAVCAVRNDHRALVDVLVDTVVSLVTTQRYRTLARYELSLAAMRDPQLRAALVCAGDTVRAFGAQMLRDLGVADAARSAEELLAMLDGLLFTMLVRGPQEPAAIAEALGPSVERAVRAQLGVSGTRTVAQGTEES
ncbi:TetR/AcrR family transcriptional regulator [Pseudonocardia adelaidensis]|uniref:ABC-F family ATP-binding cassette domain-containing protein n=1 Tax=Pseudonocardia adelaidensis TaxID=648754 RepID=A0ABP9NG44_9PSEU